MLCFQAPLSDLTDALRCRIDWSTHRSDHCVNTGWRVLPYWVVLHVVEGAYHCEWAEGGGVSARPGRVLLVPAGARHALSFEAGTVTDGLHISFSLHHAVDVFSGHTVPTVISDEAAGVARATASLTALLANQGTDALQVAAARQAAAYGFLAQVLAVSRERPERRHHLAALKRLEAALALIDRHVDRVPTVEELAARCALSRNRFTELFKATLGQSPKQYLDQQRLRRAMSLLVHSDQAVAEIATGLGFCDPFHFSKRFKQLTGESPSDYRRQVRQTLLR
ncbi:AraC family transcriptional regulator [Cobetia marina]|uniref:AraC family transcriptional regulator n=1 Tax=Cobetia marina TaxID=28258 RepID=A0ABU9GDY5_COBMA